MDANETDAVSVVEVEESRREEENEVVQDVKDDVDVNVSEEKMEEEEKKEEEKKEETNENNEKPEEEKKEEKGEEKNEEKGEEKEEEEKKEEKKEEANENNEKPEEEKKEEKGEEKNEEKGEEKDEEKNEEKDEETNENNEKPEDPTENDEKPEEENKEEGEENNEIKPKIIPPKEKETDLVIKETEGKDVIFENGYKEREYTQDELAKLDHINNNLKALSPANKLKFLRKAAQEPHGFVGGKTRAHAWALLLGLDDEKRLKIPPGFLAHALQGTWTTQVIKDTDRSLFEWVGDDERPPARRHLTSIIVKVLELGWVSAERSDFSEKRPKDLPQVKGVEENVPQMKELYYFQGFHDIASTVMLTTNSEEMTVNILYALARGTLAPLFESTMYPTLDIINGIFKVIEKVDSELSDFIKRSSVTPIFALSWVLTWFSHNVRDLSALQRIFDYLIASQEMSDVVLLSAAYILTCRGQLLSLRCDCDDICMFFKSRSPSIVLSAREAGLEAVTAKTTKPGGCVEVDALIEKAAWLRSKLSRKIDYALLSGVVVAGLAVGIGVGMFLAARK